MAQRVPRDPFNLCLFQCCLIDLHDKVSALHGLSSIQGTGEQIGAILPRRQPTENGQRRVAQDDMSSFSIFAQGNGQNSLLHIDAIPSRMDLFTQSKARLQRKRNEEPIGRSHDLFESGCPGE
jgi:hypothetical protein